MPILHHVCVNVADLDVAITFFEAVGFTDVSRWDNAGTPAADVVDPAGGGRIELAQRGDGRSDGRLAHVALQVEDIGAVRAVVLEQGGRADEISRGSSGSAYFFGAAPDGTPLEIRSLPGGPDVAAG